MIIRSKLSIYFNIFDNFWSILISFLLKSIDFKLFNIIRTRFNQIRRDNFKSSFKFGSKMLIKRRFDHNISRFGDLDQLHCLILNWMVARIKNRTICKPLKTGHSKSSKQQSLEAILPIDWVRKLLKTGHKLRHTTSYR